LPGQGDQPGTHAGPLALLKVLSAPYNPGLGRERDELPGQGVKGTAWTAPGGPPCSLLTWVREGGRVELPGQGVNCAVPVSIVT
jgi:hypothetical protein